MKTAVGLVRLDYSTEVVQHTDLCPVRARERAVLRVSDRVTYRVWPCIPNRAVSKPNVNQIHAVPARAGPDLVNLAAGGPPKAVLSIWLGYVLEGAIRQHRSERRRVERMTSRVLLKP